MQQIEDKREAFHSMGESGEINQVIAAFVIFRSMEGVLRAKRAFGYSSITKGFFRIFYCCVPEKMQKRKLRGKFLRVEEAVEPDLLIWQNFGVTRAQSCLRVLLYIVYVVIMLGGCFLGVVFLENTLNEADKEIPSIACPQVAVTKELAHADWKNFVGTDLKANGNYHCYCKNVLET